MSPKEIWQITLAVLAALGGGGAIVFALSSWLGKVWAARILERDRRLYAEELEKLRANIQERSQLLDARLNRGQFASQMHFDAEFRATQAVWQAVAEARRTMTALRPSASTSPVEETHEDKLKRLVERRGLFREARNALVNVLDDRSPYLAEAVFECADEVRKVVVAEDLSVSLASPEAFTLEWFKAGEANRTKLLELCESLAERTRTRFTEASALPDGPPSASR